MHAGKAGLRNEMLGRAAARSGITLRVGMRKLTLHASRPNCESKSVPESDFVDKYIDP